MSKNTRVDGLSIVGETGEHFTKLKQSDAEVK